MRFVAVCAGAVICLFLSVSAAADPANDDPFLWLEDIRGPRALDWVRGQNDFTSRALKRDPGYAADQADAEEILLAADRIAQPSLAGGQVYNVWQDRMRPPGLWRRTSLSDYQSSNPQWETLLDLDALSAREGENWVWKGAQCLPPEFRRCLVRLARNGRDAVVVREFDVATRAFVVGGFSIAEAKTEIAWVDANTVLVATNFSPDSLTRAGYPRIVKRWRRGEQLRDAAVVFEGEASDVNVAPRTAFGAAGQVDRFVVRGLGRAGSELFNIDPAWRVTRVTVPPFADFKGLHRRQLLFFLNRDWRTAGRTFLQGSVVSISLDEYLSTGGALPAIRSLFTPAPRSAVTAVAVAKDAVYLALLENVKGRVHEVTFDDGKWLWRQVELPDNGTVEIAAASDADGAVMLKYASFLVPDALYLVAPGAEAALVKQLPARFDPYGFEVQQYEAQSADGTKVPYFVVAKEDALKNGRTPVVLYAYGGFNVATTPWYWSTAGKLWLEKGGAYAIANVRGGGEFGPRWHEAAKGINRQKNFDDLAAVARDMIARGLTSPRRLGLMGASQGGLLVAGTFVQNPPLFNAAVAQAPLADMLRYPKLSAGASWLAEYGDPADPRQRAAILRWSPYHNIQAGVRYARVLVLGAANDDRVHPAHARKLAAKLQANGHPFLYYESEAAHDPTRTLRLRAEQLALTFTYFRQQLMD